MKNSKRARSQTGWILRLFWSGVGILCSAAAFGESTPAGRYILQTADGKPLPAVVAENNATGHQREVASGWIALGSDRTFTWRTVYRTTENGSVSTSESGGGGKYSLKGNAVSLAPDGHSAALEGTVRNGTLAIHADVKLVYEREK